MRSILTTLLISILIAVANPVAAMHAPVSVTPDTGAIEIIGSPDHGAYQGGCTSLSQAVEQVKRQYRGRIVSAETKVRGNQETHVIKVLTDDGKVKTVQVPGCRRN